MSFADNLTYIRQYYGVTQETLAEQLGVSRQTISKWEAGINFPETDKLLMLCDIYNTNLDDLLRGSVEIANEQDTDLYDAHMNRFSKMIAIIPVLVLVGVSILIVLDAMGFADNLSAVIMFTFIVIASILGVVAGLNHSEFKRKHSEIDPHYSDATLDEFGRKFTIMVSVGVGMILLDVIMLIGLSPEEGDIINLGFGSFPYDFIMGPFLIIIGIASSLLAYAALQKEKYDRSEITYITKDGAPARSGRHVKTPSELKRDHVLGVVCGAIMIFAVIVFLIWGFLPSVDQLTQTGFDKFEFKEYIRSGYGGFALSWIAFPIGGLLCGIVCLIGSALFKSSEEIIAEARKEDPWIKIDEGNHAEQSNQSSDNEQQNR